jgi:biotin operon repressor
VSGKLTGMVFDRYPEGGGEMLLALKLADNAHDDGTHIFPSVDTMAEKTRQSRRAVQYQLKRMRESGWLILTRAARGGRETAGRPAEYRINPEWIKGADFASLKKLSTDPLVQLEKGAEIAPINSGKGANGDMKGCKTEQERVQNGAEKGAKLLHPNHQLTPNEPPINLHLPAESENEGEGEEEKSDIENPTQTEPATPFDRFWEVWPSESGRKTGARAKCEKLWADAGLDAHAAVIVIHVQAMNLTPKWKKGWEPEPSRYLSEQWWKEGAPAPISAAIPADGTPWFESTPEVIEARGAELSVRPRKPDEAIASYRVLVVNASKEKSAVDFVLRDAKKFNDQRLYEFAVATFGDALMPTDFYA